MHFETLRKKKFKCLNILIFFLFTITIITINISRADYKVTESINIVRGTINYKLADLNMIAIYQENDSGDYEEISVMPGAGYVINESSSYCTINGEKDTSVKLYTNDNMEHVFLNIQKGSKCYLYFDLITNFTIAHVLENKTINIRSEFSNIVTTDTTGIIYSIEDDYGTSYYYAGAPTDNWVKFAGFYWRIIRINGDGTIRLIYSGDEANVAGEETQIGTSKFNSSTDDNAYVGYTYSVGSLHGLSASSTIKGTLESWYINNLANYGSYIDVNSGFCGDRTPYTDSAGTTSGGGTGSTVTFYGDYIRYYSIGTPSMKCNNANDLYTMNISIKGNKALTNPIGLINMNEVWLAGGFQSINSNYYLYSGYDYWTMSPSNFIVSPSWVSFVFYVSSEGIIKTYNVPFLFGVRPVINLRADTQFKAGSLGTADSPYEVV